MRKNSHQHIANNSWHKSVFYVQLLGRGSYIATPCAPTLPYSALRGTFSAQGYRLQLPPARGVWPTVLSVAHSLRRGMLYSYPLRAEYALQRPQRHFLRAGVPSTATPCARSMPYNALSGTLSAQGYRQIAENCRFREDPARGVWPTVLSVAHSLRRGTVYSYPLRVDHAPQCPQWHILCAGYRLQLPPARRPCPTVPSVAHSLRRGTVYSYPLRADHALQCPQWHYCGDACGV